MKERIVILIDMDCFYVQVEERDNPSIKGKPAAVVQYNTWKGGGIIAVNYEARHYGVKRGMRGDDARKKFSEIQLVQVPVQREKADLTKYRRAGREVIQVLSEFSNCVERASIDEAYIDLTNTIDGYIESYNDNINSSDLHSTYLVPEVQTGNIEEEGRVNQLEDWISGIISSCSQDLISNTSTNLDRKLAFAAKLCENIRERVLEKTGFNCSAGISNNKMLAKLACGLHKPNRQTVLRPTAVANLWTTIPIGKVRLLGGKLGDTLVETCACTNMSDLAALPSKILRKHFDEKTVSWLEDLGRGIDTEPVRPRQNPKSVGCSKNFLGKNSLNTKQKLQTWLENLTDELSERLSEDKSQNNRRPKTLTVSVNFDSKSKHTSFSKSSHLHSADAKNLLRQVTRLVDHADNFGNKLWFQSITNIGISAGKFEEVVATGGMTNIQEMFSKQPTSNKLATSETINALYSSTSATPTSTASELAEQQPTIANNKHKSCQSDSDRCSPIMKSFFKKYKRDNMKRQSEHLELHEEPHQTKINIISTSRDINTLHAMEQQIPSTSRHDTYRNISPDIFNNELIQVDGGKSQNLINTNISCKEICLEKTLSLPLMPNEACDSISSSKIIEYAECDECGDTFPNEYLSEHKDFHFAVKLRNEQLTEIGVTSKDAKKRNSSKGKRKSSPLKSAAKNAKIYQYFSRS